MTNLMKKFEKWIMSYTYSERRTKQLFMFNDELRHYSAMDKDELQFEYINCKTEYEHKAIIFTVTVVISAVFFSKRLFTTLNEYIMYNNNLGVLSQDAYIIYFTLITVIVLSLVICVIMALSATLKDMMHLKRKFYLIEYVINNMDNSTCAAQTTDNNN